jgi:hypothetical protein
MRTKFAILVTLAAISHANAEGLTGQVRSAFIGNVTEQCMQTLGEKDVLKRTFCACVATGMADRLSVDEARATIESARRGRILNEVAAQCLADLAGVR